MIVKVIIKCNLFCLFHLQILAVLAAITEVIKQKGGTETETEYFAALVSEILQFSFKKIFAVLTCIKES